jgi:NADPH:quinone reductase-like Zn-dependent oxidoreductase
MAQAIMLRDHGGPAVLRPERIEPGRSGPGELRIRQVAIGVNFHHCHLRSGPYRILPLPGVPGVEAAGLVEELGPGVTGFAPGDRIGYVTGGRGVDAAYDSVGRDTFDASLACLAAPSATLSRPILFHYIAERPALDATSATHQLLAVRQAEAPLVLVPQDTNA